MNKSRSVTSDSIAPAVQARASQLLAADYTRLLVRTDYLFGGIMLFQWLAAIAAALFISPRTWSGAESQWHVHVYAALILGGIITIFPVCLIVVRPGQALTRHVVAIAQMTMSALLIHLMGGRIETHFHVFGSLAFLAFYRDWRVLISASVVVAADHFVRGIYWPQSVFGVLTASDWRWLEHAGWVVFEDAFLIRSCVQSVRDMKTVSLRHAELDATNDVIEAKVRLRTEELAEHRRLLEATVQERTQALQVAMADLQETNAHLERANMHRSRFLSMMSHELRTPLNAILGFADLLRSQGFGPLNDKQQDYVKRIDSSGTHLLALINEVLDLAKIDVGATELDLQPVDTEGLVSGTVQLLSPQFSMRRLTPVVSVERGVHTLQVDERRCKQILINLLSNAIKYAPEGSDIEIRACNADDGVKICVTDHGVGIEPEEKERIFEEFHQANRKRDEAMGGIGLGLALCRRIVELHGGAMGVESEPGHGSTFWFVMPNADYDLVPEPESETADAAFAAPAAEKRFHILVAEDNEANLDMIVDMLSLRNYEVLVARDGQECLRLASAQRPDLILTDIRMPLMDGLEVTKTLRTMDMFQDTPIIALTANASAVSAQECIDAGCTEHLSKPIRSDQLYDALDRYLPQEDPMTLGAI